jgi:hypothetical protein
MVLGGVLSIQPLRRHPHRLDAGRGPDVGIISYAAFKLLATARLGDAMTVLENNAMQSIATAAGYMTAPLKAKVLALMLLETLVLR